MLNSEIRFHTTFTSNFEEVTISDFVCNNETIRSNEVSETRFSRVECN